MFCSYLYFSFISFLEWMIALSIAQGQLPNPDLSVKSVQFLIQTTKVIPSRSEKRSIRENPTAVYKNIEHNSEQSAKWHSYRWEPRSPPLARPLIPPSPSGHVTHFPTANSLAKRRPKSSHWTTGIRKNAHITAWLHKLSERGRERTKVGGPINSSDSTCSLIPNMVYEAGIKSLYLSGYLYAIFTPAAYGRPLLLRRRNISSFREGAKLSGAIKFFSSSEPHFVGFMTHVCSSTSQGSRPGAGRKIWCDYDFVRRNEV